MTFKLETVGLSSGTFVILFVSHDDGNTWGYANEEERIIFQNILVNKEV